MSKKSFSYNWMDEIYLLHIEVQNKIGRDSILTISRINNLGENKSEDKIVSPGTDRFICMRLHPSEESITVSYDNDISIKIYELLDRAYYPFAPLYTSENHNEA